jgi:hypothetical protein
MQLVVVALSQSSLAARSLPFEFSPEVVGFLVNRSNCVSNELPSVVNLSVTASVGVKANHTD